MVKAARASMPPRRRFFFFFAKTSSASSVTKRTTGFSIVGDRRGLVGRVVGRARQQEFYFGKKKNDVLGGYLSALAASANSCRQKEENGARLGLRSYEQERVRAALGSDGEFALR